MENRMNIYYDDERDYLEITSGDISNSYFDNIGNGVFKVIDKETGEVRGIAIFSFKKRITAPTMIAKSQPKEMFNCPFFNIIKLISDDIKNYSIYLFENFIFLFNNKLYHDGHSQEVLQFFGFQISLMFEYKNFLFLLSIIS